MVHSPQVRVYFLPNIGIKAGREGSTLVGGAGSGGGTNAQHESDRHLEYPRGSPLRYCGIVPGKPKLL